MGGGARFGRRPMSRDKRDDPTVELDDGAADAADPDALARSVVLDQLSAAPRTRAQLADALARRGVGVDVASAALDRFTELGYVDDAAFAAAWVQSRSAGRGLARRALGNELRTKGVAPALVEEALDALDPRQEEESARELIARKLSSTRRLQRPVRERRVLAMLARKGYPPGDALRLIREALASEAGDEPDDRASSVDQVDSVNIVDQVDQVEDSEDSVGMDG